MVPHIRIRQANDTPLRPEAGFVLYWMIANRRTSWNFALDRAVWWALELQKPLVILEALEADYPFASERFHWFVMQGMLDNSRRLEGLPCYYYPFVEWAPGAGRGLVEALGAGSAVAVTDDYPCFFLPRMVNAAAKRIGVRLECVDANGLLPLDAGAQAFVSAYHFRRFLQKHLPSHLNDFPQSNPFHQVDLPSVGSRLDNIIRQWPPMAMTPEACRRLIDRLPLDHRVGPVERSGGIKAAGHLLKRFIADGLHRYDLDHNHPDKKVASELSPYLHFGQISVHEVFDAVMREGDWFPEKLSSVAKGQRSGWWGVTPPVESFLDQLITWRELGFNMCRRQDDYYRYESLPEWARATLEDHEIDPRPRLYTFEELEDAQTDDDLWNAAQRQLLRQGVIQNYLRMLWGKKILEWTSGPRDALKVMIELNDKWALDGRDPNSYSGIFWILGRYDRGFQERPIFGKVRYMSSLRTRQKLQMTQYLNEFGA